MKLSGKRISIAALLLVTMLWASCKKEVSNQSFEKPQELQNMRLSGVIEDDPNRVSKVPMIISSDLLKKAINEPALLSALRGGKTIKPTTDLTAPTVSITSPSNGATVSGTTNIAVNAADNVGVSSVNLTVDGADVGTLATAPYNFTWTADGNSHSLTATAKDAAGNSSFNTITVAKNTVTADITKPDVIIQSPSNGSSVSGTMSVNINATDNIGVSSVSLSLDGTVIGTTTTSPYTFSWNTNNTTDGAHALTATAIDAAGNLNSYTITVGVRLIITVLPPTEIPAGFQLLTSPAGNQGNEGSCVAFAIAYAARSIEQYYKTNATSYSFDLNIFSPEYVYNQTVNSECGLGTSITLVLDLIQNQGVSTWQSMPYSDVNGCSLQPDPSQVANASDYKISNYVKIPNTDQVAIKTMVASRHPVITNIIADNSFVNAGPGFIWKSYSGSGSLPHTIIICGYDDTKHAYKIMNSYGTSWGDAGFTWIDYDFFPQKSSYYTYVIQ
jgi:C1A family cysteine protease